MTSVHSVCNFCHVHCPTLVQVQDGRATRLEADRDHPYGGLFCVKGKAAPELRDHPDRVLFPLKRTSPKTAAPEWARVSWDEALDDIADRLLRLRAEHGPETIVFSKGTPSGTGMGDAQRWLSRLSNLLGTPNTVSTTHLCQWPRDEGTRYTFGVSMPTPDFERAGCFLLWGCNPSATNIRMANDIQAARSRGMKLITVDPRRVGVATQSDIHLPVLPGTDGALALSLAHELTHRGWFDEEFVRQWTNAPLLVRRDTGQPVRWAEVAADGHAADYVAWAGEPVRYSPDDGFGVSLDRVELDATPTVRLANGQSSETATVFHLLQEILDEFPPERAAAICNVSADDIRAAAELLAEHRPVAHYFWNGITQHTNAAQNGRAINVLYALLGDWDAPGGNVVTPRLALREVEMNGILAKEEVERRLGWEERPLGAPRTRGASTAYDLYNAVTHAQPYQVRALLAFGNNMVMGNGGSLEGKAALERLELMVAVDHFVTPTAQFADYVLPAATFLEAPALVTGWGLPIRAQTHLQYRPQAVPPRGEVRSDTEIIFDLAQRLGLGDQFWSGDVEEAFRYELEPTGVTLEDLKSQPVGIQTRPEAPVVGGRGFARNRPSGQPQGFGTATRKIELFAVPFAEHGQDPLPRYTPPHWSAEQSPKAAAKYPYVLTNAKTTQFVHGQHRGLPSLRRARPHPEIELHPDTAREAGVAQGSWADVETPEGSIRVRVRVNAAIKPGVVVGQHGWWQECAELGLPGYSPFTPDGANANLLVSNQWRDPISGGTPHRSARCRLRPIEASGEPS